MAELFYDVRWSNDCDEKFIDDFNRVQDQVFKGVHNRWTFKHKYLDNIYGPSVLVVVYDSDKPVAARALWRNDINGMVAYQPGGTCVLSEYRGAGIFSKMTEIAVKFLPEEALIYNFPNQYSYPGYIKMGWTLFHERHLRLFVSKSAYLKEHPMTMDKEYYDWWVRWKHKSCIRRGNDYFLVKKIKPFCYEIISKIDMDIAKECTIKKGLFVVFYLSKYQKFYSKRLMPSRTVAKNFSNVSYIPKWKIDAI